MIDKLSIQNFKSIRDVSLNCKRINLFIGEPNTGKSNLLEALSLFALPYTRRIPDLVRINDLSNIFFENDLSNSVLVQANSNSYSFQYQQDQVRVTFEQEGRNQVIDQVIHLTAEHVQSSVPFDFEIHPYFFKNIGKFDRKGFDFLTPPHGENLYFILQSNKQLRLLISDFVQDRGFKLTFRQSTSEIEISKEEDNILTTYPYKIISDTLQRIIFYISAIESNKAGTSLIFEEPESNVFPYYTKYLAEKIAYSSDKQFFLTTHNPYFLQSIIQKTPVDELQVNIVHMPSYLTKVRSIFEKNEIEELIDLDSSVFLNLDKFLTE